MKIFAKGWSMNKDGPGNRCIYYLKGCDLRCLWCASPESICAEDQLLFYPGRTEEKTLDHLCPSGAICGIELDRDICRQCSNKMCRSMHHRSLEWVGTEISVDELEKDILEAVRGWGNCAGVTFGGGEPSLQAPQLLLLLHRLKKHNIHTAFESNAAGENFKCLAGSADLVITDLKAGTQETFFRCTGGNWDKVRENHLFAAEKASGLLIRIPLITTLNDSEKELFAMREILKELNKVRIRYHGENIRVELLKLHHFGEVKYKALGIDYPAAGLPLPTLEKVAWAKEILLSAGIQVKEG